MTGPSQPAPPPGWYPDPDGAAGQVRWWNGVTWSDVTTPAGPGVAVQASPLLAPPVRPGAANPPELLASGPGGPGRIGWVIGISLLVLVLVVGAGLLVGSAGGEGSPAATSSSSAAVPPLVPAPGPSTFPPGTVRIIDEAAGISYPYLGEGWLEFDLFPQAEVTSIAGQYFTTQELTPDNTIFIAQCTSGPLADGYGWGGPATLASTVATVADSVRGNYYPQPNERRVLREEERTVDGHAAYLYEFQLSWNAPGYDATGERAALLLVDVGRPAPALLYVSIPNTHAELYGVIDRVVGAVEVL
ncbi:DUF2510 domain-containing protein [Blastococcus sp. PRF04-17]|uniref:DUF2510 domain-containing protein n=1 Tax=Blastococcus sp. PRF04-17 TaxID=2933797 RepID=UPI001FF4C61B|nr:DUF2510 domain-containing protein [Blastococcus sp. PRF04-17]UOY01301.1 DUF2510 domain-containing protein [Blastococcus sp. PRF04-17]